MARMILHRLFGAGNKRGGDALVVEPVVTPKPAEMVMRLSKK